MTADVTQERIRKVLAGVLAPLARILLRCGVSYTEFSELAKQAFVSAASTDYGVRNRPTNTARVAVMTGLSRKEVSRIRGIGQRQRKPSPSNVTLPAAVLNAWYTDSRYMERQGVPKVLSFAGPNNSFSSLVRSISRDIPPGAMRQELIRAGAIRRVDRSRLIPIKRFFVPDSADERVIVGLELGLRRLAETIAFNSDKQRQSVPRFQRFVEGQPISAREVPAIRKHVQDMLAGFSLAIDDYLSSKTRAGKGQRPLKRDASRVGVGLYYFDDTRD